MPPVSHPWFVSLARMITERSKQEIIAATRIEEVVGDFVRLKKRGSNLLGNCPFHQEKTPSFNVHPAKGIFKCFGCGKAGDAITFLQEHEKFSFEESLRFLAQKYQIQVEEVKQTDAYRAEQQRYEGLYLINEFARQWYERQLHETDLGKSIALHYFQQRGLRLETIQRFGLGYAPEDRKALTDAALASGYNLEQLVKTGLSRSSGDDFFRARVLFPIFSLTGKVIGFGGRTLSKEKNIPKYLNTPETEIYTKSKTLFGAFQARKAIATKDECILVEGYMDVISLFQAGVENVVASSGTSLTQEQVALVKRFTSHLTILYDGDAAGIKAALRGADLALEQDLNLKVALLPPGEDPDSFVQREGTDQFLAWLEQEKTDFVMFKTKLLLKDAGQDPVKKTSLVRDIVESIALIPDPIKRAFYVRECAGILSLDEQIITGELNKIILQRLEKLKAERTRPSYSPQDAPLPEEAPPVIAVATEPNPVRGHLQERDLARVVVVSGHREMDIEGERYRVAEYILHNLEDVLDRINHTLYHKILWDTHQQQEAGVFPGPEYYIQHPDPEISKFTVDCLTPEYEYSANWIEKFGLYLRSQPMPEENFARDATMSILYFKLRKIDEIISENQQRLKDPGLSMEEVQHILEGHQHLMDLRRQISGPLNIVVLPR